jgi:hypothetical protein
LRQSPCHRKMGQSKRRQKLNDNQIDAHATPPCRSKLNLTRETTLSCTMGLIRCRYRRCLQLPPPPRHVVSVGLLEIDLNCR